MNAKLFRDEVLVPKDALSGRIILISAASHWILVLVALGIIAFLGAILAFGTYTRHAEIAGVLEPIEGVTKVYSPQNGIVSKVLVKDGQSIKRGDILITFINEHRGLTGQTLESELTAGHAERLTQLRAELAQTTSLQASERDGLTRTLLSKQQARADLLASIEKQITRIRFAEEQLKRYQDLQRSGFMPEAQVRLRQDELADQEMRLSGLRRELAESDAEIDRLRKQVETSPAREEVARSQLLRAISMAETDYSQQRTGHEWAIAAPTDGVVTGVDVSPTQTAAAGGLLLSIVPQRASLQAKIYAPSRNLGFLKVGQTVNIKLDSYPFQKFGLITGEITSIAETPNLSSEFSPTSRLPFASAGQGAESLFALHVQLHTQSLEAYGEHHQLRAGMQLNADVQLDKRRLYEWVLEPLFGLTR